MTTANYNTQLHTDKTPMEVFNAINNVPAWWSANYEGSAINVNDEFTVSFGETWITSKVTDLVPGKQITWLVTDCNKHWLKDKKEWVGTTMSWELVPEGNGTQISFTHIGLAPGMECYNGCEKAWDFYISKSIAKLLSEGTGMPEKKA